MLKHIAVLALLPLVFFACKSGAQGTHGASMSCPEPHKIVVYKENVYDLSGYEAQGNNQPYNLFDENALVDPRNENALSFPYTPRTDPQPRDHPALYFPPGRGSRIVCDLQTQHRISEVYLYDRSYTSDSVWIYTGTMSHWLLKASFTTRGIPGLWGWRKFSLDDSSQYVMIRFSSYQTTITEMVLYGCPVGKELPAPIHPFIAPPFAKIPMKEFLGVNDFSGTSPEWLKPFYYSRMYAFTTDFDNDTVHPYPGVKYSMLRFGYWHTGLNDYYYVTEDNERKYNHKVWYTMIGLPLWLSHGEYGAKGRPVTLPGMDPEDPQSYARHANMMWNLAAFFGNTKVDTNLMSLSHSPRRSGRGTLSVYENGSEDDAVWIGDKYCNPLEYFAQSSADYDGNENRLGPLCGIRHADSTSSLMTGGLVGLDTNRIRIYKFLCNTLRKDKTFLWKGGIQYHYYSSRDNHGITPEEDSMRWKLARVREFTGRTAPGVPCILGENGYDKSQRSRQSTPLVPGLSAEECQAVFLLRAINATAFSGFDSYILYWLKDTNPADDPGVYLTSGIIRQMPDGSYKPYPAWYYINTFEGRLANYAPDRIIRETGNTWVYKYRNLQSPDSVAYFLYTPSHNGTRVEHYQLPVDRVADGMAQEVQFAPDRLEGILVDRPISQGKVDLTVTEKPSLLLVKEK